MARIPFGIVGSGWRSEFFLRIARGRPDIFAVTGVDEHVRSGRDFYSLAEGCQDHYLSLAVQQSLEKAAPVRTSRQPWAK